MGIEWARIMEAPVAMQGKNTIVFMEAPDGKVHIAGAASYDFLEKCMAALEASMKIFKEKEAEKYA